MRIPEDTNETTQVRELLDVGGPRRRGRHRRRRPRPARHRRLHRRRQGGRRPRNRTTSCSSRATSRGCSAPSTTPSRPAAPASRTTLRLDYSHGRIIKRSLWVTDADGMDFPHVARAARIRRDGYDAAGTLVSKEIVHAVTSLDAQTAPEPPTWPGSPAASGVSNRCTGCATPHDRKTPTPATPATGRRSWPPCGNIAISLLYLAGVTEINRTLQAIGRDRTRCSATSRYETRVTNDFADPVGCSGLDLAVTP